MNFASILSLIVSGINTGMELYKKTKAIAKQNGELTPEQEAVFDKMLEEKFKQPHWIPENEI